MSDTADVLFSVRMRASSRDGAHLCGAERLVSLHLLAATGQELLTRALNRGAAPDSIHLSIDRIPANAVSRIPCLPVTTVHAADPAESRRIAESLLAKADVSAFAISAAFDGLLSGLGPHGAPLRGAALMDASTSTRLEPDSARGLRASHLDYAPEDRDSIIQALAAAGLPHHRTYEALAVASKAIWAGVIAELCWSDEADYVAGYVATRAAGYTRFPSFKPLGARGGRVWFVNASQMDLEGLAEKVERKCALVEGPVRVENGVRIF